MALEALEIVRQAEESVEQMKRDAKQEIDAYQAATDHKVQAARQKSQIKVTKLLTDFTEAQTAELQKEKDILTAEAKQIDQSFQQQYAAHQDEAIRYVVERVKKLYGSD